ncbi:RND family efflux transporter, MFP subunit [Singulisphaera sp. GP187]|uniref:efflux RND transporter periplasmic adaptor subunit n=1 Tax=Singulisphaera sp. GP187 TaxID=1882752 RepID=UPI00092A3173|nr:efflux RND transporter periplasmic adaptor subunit [Singulisphaera sp. GP187]SIO36078.1 RND family efflux transporter, MFP subunit [Singulisphaera sp. GP187]
MSTQPSKTSKSLGEPHRRAWSPGKKLLLLALAIVPIAIGGTMLVSRERKASASSTPSSNHPAIDSVGADSVRVQVVQPERGGLTRTSTQIGSVHPFQQAQLYAKVSGYLKWQGVDIGSHVKQGEILARIDNPEAVKEADRAVAALKQARTQVAQSEARVETTLADVKATEAAVAKAKASIGSALSKRNYREKELARYRDLRARQAVPDQIVDEYEDHFETSVAEERAAEAELDSSKALLSSAVAKVNQARADLDETKANVEVIDEILAKDRVMVDYTTIRSPYDGVITLRNFFEGDFIRSAAEGNERPLLTVARTDKMRVVTYVPDRDVPLTDLGDQAVVTLDALPGHRFAGTVSRFSNSEDPETRTMRTEIDLENPNGLLREGMYGLATITLHNDSANMTIPTGCLSGKADHDQSSVFVAKEGRAHEVAIRVGVDNGIRVEILSGLEPGDQVILDKRSISEGTPVIIEKPTQVASVKTKPE